MSVGEAPGFNEDRQGEPFVGAAGKLLDTLLDRIGLSRADVYITNVLKCRPPNNRPPNQDETEKCREYLEKTLELVRPRSDVPGTSKRYGLGFWLDESTDVVILEGSDAGVSFRSVHEPGRRVTKTVISNTSTGAWPIARLLAERNEPAR